MSIGVLLMVEGGNLLPRHSSLAFDSGVSLLSTGFALLFILMGYCGIWILRIDEQAGTVNLIFHLFSFVMISTLLVSWWAFSSGAVDQQGKPHGAAGKALIALFDFLRDDDAEIRFLVGFLVLHLGSQLLAYLLSGSVGCASRPWLVRYSLKFIAVACAKTFAVAGGVYCAVPFMLLKTGWPWPIKIPKEVYSFTYVSLFCKGVGSLSFGFVVAASTAMFNVFSNTEVIDALASRHSRLRNLVLDIHTLACRHRDPSSD
jgi:hypothetical protein